MDANHVLTHLEVKGQPGYTTGGAWAGRNSVLSLGATWKNGNPLSRPRRRRPTLS